MQCAMNSVQSSVLKDYVCRKRGPAAHRGVQTLEDLLEREARQQRTVDPAVLQKREELTVAREKPFLELGDRIQNNRLLDHTLTAAEMRDVLSHLKKIKRTYEGVPQGATRAKLQEILQRIWPELHAFENDSVDAGATSRRRGPTGGDDKSREEEPPPLGCASCRGRPTGCDRCIAWRNEGRKPTSTSARGFQVWTIPIVD